MGKYKFENNWKAKSLESLEKRVWAAPDNESYLENTCHQLRKIPIGQFEIEDLRIMIGQEIGLKFLIPLAIEKLKDNLLAEGDLYEGDLLSSVLTSEKNFWKENPELFKTIVEIVHDQKNQLPKKLRIEIDAFFENK